MSMTSPHLYGRDVLVAILAALLKDGKKCKPLEEMDMIFALISLIISVFVLMLLLQRSYEDINKLNTELKEINNLQKDLLDKIDKLSEKI